MMKNIRNIIKHVESILHCENNEKKIYTEVCWHFRKFLN